MDRPGSKTHRRRRPLTAAGYIQPRQCIQREWHHNFCSIGTEKGSHGGAPTDVLAKINALTEHQAIERGTHFGSLQVDAGLFQGGAGSSHPSLCVP